MHVKRSSAGQRFGAGLAAAALVGLGPALAAGPSFDCRASRASDEAAICASAGLSSLDRQLTGLYRALREETDGAERSSLVARQREWLKSRAACGGDAACLTSAYTSRIAELKAAIKPAAPAAPTLEFVPAPSPNLAAVPSFQTLTCSTRKGEHVWEFDLVSHRVRRWPRDSLCPCEASVKGDEIVFADEDDLGAYMVDRKTGRYRAEYSFAVGEELGSCRSESGTPSAPAATIDPQQHSPR